MSIKSILVICEGNICRSPMAAALLQQQLPAVNVRSAGLGALVDYPADPTAVELMKLRAINIASHRARQISLSMIKESDIVLTMSIRQKETTIKRFSFSRGRVAALGEKEGFDIIDPYRQPFGVFEHSLAQIETGIKLWLPILQRM